MNTDIYRYLMLFCGKLNKVRLILSGRKDQTHIAMFHDIKETNEDITTDYDCRLSDLDNYIQHCKENNLQFVSMDHLLSIQWQLNNSRFAVLTFDDGFESVYTLAYPILRKNRIPFTIFITTELIGTKNHLAEKQLKELAEDKLCTIGMHANEHKMFRYETTAALTDDFIKCKAKLTKITGVSPKHYAFPYGSIYAVSGKNIKCIKSQGVSSISLTDQLMLTSKNIKHPFRLPRLDIPGYYNGRISKKYRGLGVGTE